MARCIVSAPRPATGSFITARGGVDRLYLNRIAHDRLEWTGDRALATVFDTEQAATGVIVSLPGHMRLSDEKLEEVLS